MHPADKEEFEKLHKEKAVQRREINDLKEEVRMWREKCDRYRREIRRLASIDEE